MILNAAVSLIDDLWATCLIYSALLHHLGKLCHPHLHYTLIIFKLFLAHLLGFYGLSRDISHAWISQLAVFGMRLF